MMDVSVGSQKYGVLELLQRLKKTNQTWITLFFKEEESGMLVLAAEILIEATYGKSAEIKECLSV